MDANEARVREAWEWVAYFEPDMDCDIGVVEVADRRAEGIREFTSKEPAEAWSAAAAYTETVLEEARQMREEIEEIEALLRDPMAQHYEESAARFIRIRKRLESAYAAHVRGIKPEALATPEQKEQHNG